MCFGQPDVQRQYARLGPETEEGQQKGNCWPGAAGTEVAHGIECVITGAAGHDAEGKQNADRADMGDQQVEIAGATDLGVAVLRGDEKERAERHRFPCHHERVAVVGQHDEGHTGEKSVIQQALQSG